MEPGVRSIMNDKKIWLFQKIAGSLDWPDMEIFSFLVNGFNIVGDQKPGGILILCLGVQESRLANLRTWPSLYDRPCGKGACLAG